MKYALYSYLPPVVLRTYTYDSNGWGSYLNGRLASVDYGGKWSERYSYHPAGGRTAKRLNYTWSDGQTNTTQNLDAFWTYNNEGQVLSVKYPNTSMINSSGQPATVVGDTYTYSFDAMARPKDLTTVPGDGSANYLHVQNVSYGAAGELTGIQYWSASSYITESRGYNARMQLTSLGATGNAGTIASINYSYYDVAVNQSADLTKNNGKVGQMSSTILGSTEVVNYKYDSLNRLINAYTNDTSQWGLAFDYDGFGNRLSQTVTQGSAPPMTMSIDQTTNRAGGTFDANGNLTNNGTFAMTYDVENRMLAAGSDNYDYAPDNKRVYKMAGQGNNQVESVYYYSGSKKLATYQVVYYTPQGTNQPTRFFFRLTGANVYFGGKLVQSEGTPVVTDRLGSVVWDGAKGAHRYFPYGEERTSTTNESSKFGTYFRDATTGLDYAVNRYFSSQHGRFTSPDPFRGSGHTANPGSWNRFAYVGNDPINASDPLGLVIYGPDEEGCTWDTDTNTTTCPQAEVSLEAYCAANPSAAQCPSGGDEDGVDYRKGDSVNGNSDTGTVLADFYADLKYLKENKIDSTKDCDAFMKNLKAAGSKAGILQVVDGYGFSASGIQHGATVVFDNTWLYDGSSSHTPSGGSLGATLSSGWAIWVYPFQTTISAAATVIHEIMHHFFTNGIQYHELALKTAKDLGWAFDGTKWDEAFVMNCEKGKP